MGLVEIIVGAAIVFVAILVINESYNTYVKYALTNQRNVDASYILEEGLEAMTLLRDKGWTANISKLSTTTTYYLTFASSAWSTTTTAQYVDGIFLRSISLLDVKRDASDHIASSGTYDPNIKQITSTVAYWQGHATTTRSISTFIANIYNN